MHAVYTVNDAITFVSVKMGLVGQDGSGVGGVRVTRKEQQRFRAYGGQGPYT